MREPTYNIFPHVNCDTIDFIGIAVHSQDDSDDEKFSFLRSRVKIGYNAAQNFN